MPTKSHFPLVVPEGNGLCYCPGSIRKINGLETFEVHGVTFAPYAFDTLADGAYRAIAMYLLPPSATREDVERARHDERYHLRLSLTWCFKQRNYAAYWFTPGTGSTAVRRLPTLQAAAGYFTEMNQAEGGLFPI